jgi:signal transduction histidine kinase
VWATASRSRDQAWPMPEQPGTMSARRWWTGLGWKLFAAFASVIAVGVAMLWLAVGFAAPRFFDQQMAGMMQGSGGMMGTTTGTLVFPAMDAALTVAFRDAMTQALLVATVASVLAAVVASVFVTGRIVGPLRRLAWASRRLADGHYAERVAVPSNDELGDLARSFNAMADALEATERRRRELIGDVAHELRTPIATLEGYLEGLLDGVVEPGEPTWARLHGEAGRLRRLVDDLQELSRAEARQIPLSLRPTAPSEIARVAVERLSASFAEKGLDLRSDVQPHLPQVLADSDRAIQVLSNLLSNALRYTPAPGLVELKVRPAAGEVEFSVCDSGLGIGADELPHVFERFYRVDKSRSRALGGSGIGLTIAKALAEGMGGHIRADSPGAGQGSTFTFTLPVS